MSRCADCSFFWKDDGETYGRCHYESLGEWDPAPCEHDDEHNEEEEDWSYLDRELREDMEIARSYIHGPDIVYRGNYVPDITDRFPNGF